MRVEKLNHKDEIARAIRLITDLFENQGVDKEIAAAAMIALGAQLRREGVHVTLVIDDTPDSVDGVPV